MKAGFNPDQPRDEDGRWGSGGSPNPSASAAVMATAAMAELEAGEVGLSIFGALTAPALAALASIALEIVGSALILNALFIRPGRGSTTTGTLEDLPGWFYSYDRKTGQVVLAPPGGAAPVTGEVQAEGLIRDPRGRVIGRTVEDTAIIDTAALSSSEPGDIAGAQSQNAADSDRPEPRLCPDPAPDRPGGKSEAAKDYQAFINRVVNPENPINPAFGVWLPNPIDKNFVVFDDCDQKTGDMIEAKNARYGQMARDNSFPVMSGVKKDLLNQAIKQVNAAGSRHVIWYFGDADGAAMAREVFRGTLAERIEVRALPMPGIIKRFYVGFPRYRPYGSYHTGGWPRSFGSLDSSAPVNFVNLEKR